MLTRERRVLEGTGVITLPVFPQVPTRVDYSLAEAGEHVMPIIDALGDGCEGKQQLSRGDAVRQPVLFMSRWALSS
jgi:DNA-binding HxlR family transcriptional regulator